jgi:hypothetical protein
VDVRCGDESVGLDRLDQHSLPVGLARGAAEGHRLARHRILEPVAWIDHELPFV